MHYTVGHRHRGLSSDGSSDVAGGVCFFEVDAAALAKPPSEPYHKQLLFSLRCYMLAHVLLRTQLV